MLKIYRTPRPQSKILATPMSILITSRKYGGATAWTFNPCWCCYHKKLDQLSPRTARCVVSVEILPIATQQCRNCLYDKSWTKYRLSLLTRATKSCCRQRLTICAISYSGRALELGGIIDLVDRRRPSLSCSERPPFSSQVANTFRRSICVAKFSNSGV